MVCVGRRGQRGTCPAHHGGEGGGRRRPQEQDTGRPVLGKSDARAPGWKAAVTPGPGAGAPQPESVPATAPAVGGVTAKRTRPAAGPVERVRRAGAASDSGRPVLGVWTLGDVGSCGGRGPSLGARNSLSGEEYSGNTTGPRGDPGAGLPRLPPSALRAESISNASQRNAHLLLIYYWSKIIFFFFKTSQGPVGTDRCRERRAASCRRRWRPAALIRLR